METNSVIPFIAIATLLVMSPGPNGFLIAKTVSTSGKTFGFINTWGFVAAFYIHGTLSIFGISLLLIQSAQIFFIFKLVGAIYLIWIGIKTLYSNGLSGEIKSKENHSNIFTRSTSKHSSTNHSSIKSAFSEGFLTNMLNPKVSMFYLAAFPQFIDINNSIFSGYGLVTLHAIVNLIWFSTMVWLFSHIHKISSAFIFKKWLNFFTGMVFIAFGAKLAFLKNE